MKLILMTVPATLVCTEPVWTGSIATAVSALQDSQVMLLAFRGASISPELEKGPLSESHCFLFFVFFLPTEKSPFHLSPASWSLWKVCDLLLYF